MTLKDKLIQWVATLEEAMAERVPEVKATAEDLRKRIENSDSTGEVHLEEVLMATLFLGTFARVPDLEALRKRILPFDTACKLPRQDDLGKVLNSIIEPYIARNLKRPTLEHVIVEIEKSIDHDLLGTIQEVNRDLEQIEWINKKGTESTTSFKSINNRITTISKKYLSLKIPPSR